MSRFDRQSFLGPNSTTVLRGTTVGLVGLGGGGSHVAQQFAHIGIGGYVLVDPDIIEDTNTNRLIGGTTTDVLSSMAKTEIAARLILGLNPGARIKKINASWHEATEDLKHCDLIMGGLDSFIEREQLERFARRHLTPYIDIGMDVHEIGGTAYLIAGQIVRSCPGEPCLRCCGIITDHLLSQEAKTYGAAGSRPQVVWPNGVLASTAVGLAMQMLTPWHRLERGFAMLEYDGNRSTVITSKRYDLLKDEICAHHPADEAGDPLFDIRSHLKSLQPNSDTGVRPWWRKLFLWSSAAK